jgi:uncharacterized membrane protein YjgN (DUF898 family)
MQEQLDAAAAALPDPPASAGDAIPQPLELTFSGSGKEYFRIWVVNLLLTIATLGIYSAWAKVRRLQYFDRNTHLAGATFDFQGDPKAILRGRVLAVILVAAYQYAFGFSLEIGLAVIAFLLLALPFLMRGALRFRLSNTVWRGLPFGFSGTARGAYLTYLPPMLTFLLPGVLLALFPTSALVAFALPLYLAWPLMHGWMKRYQHRHLLYGDQPSHYDVPARRFYRPYLMAGLFWFLGILAFALAMTLIMTVVMLVAGRGPGAASAVYAPLLLMIPLMYFFYLLAGPYMQVRLANLAWSNTSFPGLRIRSTMVVSEFMMLQTVNAVLTLLTLGLYRPFAVVRVYRYRLAHLHLEADGDFERAVAGAGRTRDGATGDGAADFLGIDLSW